MACSEEAMKYNKVTDTLINTFGDVLHRDAIYSIVESCYGNLNHAANAIMSITSEENIETSPVESPAYGASTTNSEYAITKKVNSRNDSTKTTSGIETKKKDTKSLPKVSYAKASTSLHKNTIPKQKESPIQNFPKFSDILWTDQLKRIFSYHNQGTRTLVIMRGAPGSGKSYLAHKIQEMTVGADPQNEHIFSTDDFFLTSGYYKYDKMSLKNAHSWNQHRTKEVLEKGVSPVIIDNTNIEYWEIFPYAKEGVRNGYVLEVVEPNTSWAKNLYQLTMRNSHGVPQHTIKKMLGMLQFPISSRRLITNLKLAYPPNMKPPVLRCIPNILPNQDNKCTIDEEESPLQQANNLMLDGKGNEYTPFTTEKKLNIDAEAEISKSKSLCSNERIKYIVLQEGDNIKVKVDMENLDLKSDKDKIDDQFDVTCETIEKYTVIEKADTCTISRDQNVTFESQLLHQDRKKDEYFSGIHHKVDENDCTGVQNISQSSDTISRDQNATFESQLLHQDEKDEYFSGIHHKVDENDCIGVQNISQSSDPQFKEEEMTLKKTSESHTPNIIECKGGQVKFEKILEEFQKVENDWDNGEPWEKDTNTNNTKPITEQLNTSISSKSPRRRRCKENEKTLQTLDDENDWRKIYMPMSTFTDNNNLSSILSKNVVETKSAETCMEVGDTDISHVKNGFKVIHGMARDININYVPNGHERIPENRKFDKSTLTNEVTIMTGTHRCKNEEKHFIRFRNMFKSLKKDDLRDIFDKCCGDVNWAVSIVIDDMPNNQFECISLDEQSEIEEDSDEPCDCTSFYGIIPDGTPIDIKEEHIFNVPCSSATITESINPIKKQKKDSPLSDSSLALKHQIEQNIVISDQHYSENFLKVRKMRRGDEDHSTSQNINTGITIQTPNQSDSFQTLRIDTSNTNAETQDVSGPSTFEVVDSEYNSDEESSYREMEKTVTINLGVEFLSQLDALFGRADMDYDDNIETKVKMPITMLNQINALWMESLMNQLEALTKSHDNMIKQDEDFARAVALEQLELSKSGKEPEIPNLKEIMDMEYALSLYRKDCAEWMQKDRPTDMAAKLSVKKLYDLFPEIPQADLDEILMAHHYDFYTTVGVLLQTQGRSDITLEENGINKFIMAKELERQDKFMATEKKRLLELEWPELPTQVDARTVNTYRHEAKQHLAQWNKNSGKAKSMVKKNVAVANYYNNLAGLHLLQYQRANSVAAASLLQIHANNSGSKVYLDLHFLHVDEAIATLDMFLDSHIQLLRMSRGRDRSTVLFIVTGRGLHSRGGPKIKPAVMEQLTHRNLSYKEINPGLLSLVIAAEDKLSYQVS